MIKDYLKRVGARRILVMIFGNIFLGMGVSIFKLAGLGNDAFNGMLMSLANCLRIEYAVFFIIFSVALFIIEFLTGRSFIGIGTIINTFFLGYIVTFFYNIWDKFFPVPSTFFQQVIIMLIGVLIGSLGISMYQMPDVGVSPYDSLSLIMAKHFNRIPYFWCRMLTDELCALVCFLSGGLIGPGTLVAAFGFGPFIQFFNVHITGKILNAG